ncbi:MAG TPA: ABC transporter permease [Beijerinckiaceae bacterium]|nr:ABC transporter permease [Beijerinckiaceae bacterium]
MAATSLLSAKSSGVLSPVARVRITIILVALLAWEALAASGLLFQDVVPSFVKIGAALAKIVADPAFYRNLGATAYEVFWALLVGGVTGLAAGIVLGGSRFLSRAYEPFLYYLGPTPKIIFFPVMIMWFGVGPGSKIAMGAVSCFFPVALSAAAGMREVDKVLIRVGRSFRANTQQMVTKIYLPAMRAPIINGVRLGMGVAIIGVLLAETKLSNQGLGFMIIQAYTLFNMPQMYALLIIVFVIAALINAGIDRLNRSTAPGR